MTALFESTITRPPGLADVDSLANRIIHRRVRELLARDGFQEADREDLRQEMLADLYHRLPNFDPEKGSLRGFIAMVIDHRVAAIIAHCGAARRDRRRCTRSLDEIVVDDDGELVPLWATLEDKTSRSHLDERRGS